MTFTNSAASKGFFSFPVIWKEKRFARDASVSMLSLFNRLREDNPALDRISLYKNFVRAYLKVDAKVATDILEKAEESFASWPTERPLKFADIVHYIIVIEYMRKNKLGAIGPHFKEIVDETIPYQF